MLSFNEMCGKHLHGLSQCSQPLLWLVLVNLSLHNPNLKLEYMTTHQKNGIIDCKAYVCIGLRRVKSYSNASRLILNLTTSSERNEYTRTTCSHQFICVTMCSETLSHSQRRIIPGVSMMQHSYNQITIHSDETIAVFFKFSL